MTEKIELPDYLKDLVDDSTQGMLSAVGGGVPRISIRGRMFRFMVDGEEIHKQTEPINVIILGVVPEVHMAKTFYINGYQPGSTDPPDCSSFHGEIADSWIDTPQSDNCKNCQQNKWGSATSMAGKKAKACKDSKRLIVIPAKNAKEEEPVTYIFNVTIASLKALSEYGKFLISNKLPMSAVITQIAFVDSEFPQVEFNYTAILAAKIGLKMLGQAAEKPWLLDKPITSGTPQIAAPVKSEAPSVSTPVVDESNPPPPADEDVPAKTDAELIDNW